MARERITVQAQKLHVTWKPFEKTGADMLKAVFGKGTGPGLATVKGGLLSLTIAVEADWADPARVERIAKFFKAIRAHLEAHGTINTWSPTGGSAHRTEIIELPEFDDAAREAAE